MKITFDIELTPEEARIMLGLPDFKPMHEAVANKMQEKMETAVNDMGDPEYWLKTYFPLGVQGMDSFQKMMGGMAGAASKASDKE